MAQGDNENKHRWACCPTSSSDCTGHALTVSREATVSRLRKGAPIKQKSLLTRSTGLVIGFLLATAATTGRRRGYALPHALLAQLSNLFVIAVSQDRLCQGASSRQYQAKADDNTGHYRATKRMNNMNMWFLYNTGLA